MRAWAIDTVVEEYRARLERAGLTTEEIGEMAERLWTAMQPEDFLPEVYALGGEESSTEGLTSCAQKIALAGRVPWSGVAGGSKAASERAVR